MSRSRQSEFKKLIAQICKDGDIKACNQLELMLPNFSDYTFIKPILDALKKKEPLTFGEEVFAGIIFPRLESNLSPGQNLGYDIVRAKFNNKESFDHPVFLNLLGSIRLDDNFGEALKHYQKAADSGYYLAQYVLGSFYELGTIPHIGIDIDKAVTYYELLVQQKFSPALLRMGLLYLNKKISLPDSFRIGLQMIQEAASQGFGEAQVKLGELYEQGLIIPRKDSEAVAWYMKAKAFPQALRVLEKDLNFECNYSSQSEFVSCRVTGNEYRFKRNLGEGSTAKVILVEDSKGTKGVVKMELLDGNEYTRGNYFYNETLCARVKFGIAFLAGEKNSKTIHSIFLPYFPEKDLADIPPPASSVMLLNLLESFFAELLDTTNKGLLHGDLRLNNIRVNPIGDCEYEVKAIDFTFGCFIGCSAKVHRDGDGYFQIPPELKASTESITTATEKMDAYGAGDVLHDLLFRYKNILTDDIITRIQNLITQLKKNSAEKRMALSEALEIIQKIRADNMKYLEQKVVPKLLIIKDEIDKELESKFSNEALIKWIVVKSMLLKLNKRPTVSHFHQLELLMQKLSQAKFTDSDLQDHALDFEILINLLEDLNPAHRMKVLNMFGWQRLEKCISSDNIGKLIAQLSVKDYEEFFTKLVAKDYLTLFPPMHFEKTLAEINNSIKNLIFINHFVRLLHDEKGVMTHDYISYQFNNYPEICQRLLSALDTISVKTSRVYSLQRSDTEAQDLNKTHIPTPF